MRCARSSPTPLRCRRRSHPSAPRPRSLDIARQRLELGDINYLSLLNAQQTYQQALLSLAQARAARYADTVALFQALGGGWWNRADVEPERPADDRRRLSMMADTAQCPLWVKQIWRYSLNRKEAHREKYYNNNWRFDLLCYRSHFVQS